MGTKPFFCLLFCISYSSQPRTSPEPGSLVHALTKVEQIRELVISYDARCEQGYTAPEEITQDDLLKLVKATPMLMSVTLHEDVPQISSPFWVALLSKSLRHLDIRGTAVVPPDLQLSLVDSPVLDKIQVNYSPGTEKLLKVCRSMYCSSTS